MQPCEQKDNIAHIHDELANHKLWRKEISKTLTDIQVICATTDSRLKSKADEWDKHVADGKGWRMMVAGASIGLVLNVAGTLIAGGILMEKLHRLEALHPYGVGVEIIK